MFGFQSAREDRRRAARFRTLATLLDGGVSLLTALPRVGIAPPATTTPPHAFPIGQLLAPGDGRPELAAERAAIDAASRAGELPATLITLADDLEILLAARRTFLARLAYPLLVLHLTPVAATTADLLTRPGRFFGNVALAYLLLWSILAAIAAALAHLQRSAAGMARLARLPLLGPPIVLLARARYFRLLAVLEGSGVLRHEALTTATAALGTAIETDGYAEFALRMRRGDPPEQALAALHRLPMEEQGELAAALTVGRFEAAARRCADRATEVWQRATSRLAKAAGACAYATAVVLVAVSVLRFYTAYLAGFKPPR